MSGIIALREILDDVPSTVESKILKTNRVLYGSLTYHSLKIGDIPDLPLTNPNWEKYVFGYGVYVFFRNNLPVYVGVADKNFKHRFQSHRFFDGRPNWDWNKLARLTADHALNQENLAYDVDGFYEQVIPELDSFEVVRINCSREELSKAQLNAIERILKYLFQDTLWNGNIKPKSYDNSRTLRSLVSIN
jgi:hypothetical protein